MSDYIKIENKKVKQVVFTGCGGMIAYYFGIAKYLQENYDLNDIIFGGVSGGSIVALFLNTKEDIKNIKKYTDSICDNINNYKTGAVFNTLDILKNSLTEYIEEKKDDEFYKNLNNNFFVSITEFYPRKKNICYWESNNDLIDSIIASCSLPLLGKSLINYYRESYCIDGVFLNNYPILYKELPVHYITPFQFRKIINPAWFYIYGNKDWFEKLYKIGYNDATNNKLELDKIFTNIGN